MAEATASKRAREFWSRMIAWYGARVAESYGTLPPPDWCKLIDAASPDAIRRSWDLIRKDHPVHPPTFPQFDWILGSTSRVMQRGPTIHEQLAEFVLSHRVVTSGQLAQSWTFVHSGGECIAVDVPADGDQPGFRVRVDEMGY